jgi:hypothetical protein
MRRLGIAPKILDWLRGSPTINEWAATVTERLNVYRQASAPTTSEVSENQWGIIKNTTTGDLALVVNDEGVLQSLPIPASGGSGWVLLDTQTAAVSASLNFTTGINSTYDAYVAILTNVIPSVSAPFTLRTSTNGGATYDNGFLDYTFTYSEFGTGAFGGSGTGSSSALVLSGNVSNAATNGGIRGMITFHRPSDTVTNKAFYTDMMKDNTTPIQGVGTRASTADVDAIQFLFTGTTIASGTIRLYGIANS